MRGTFTGGYVLGIPIRISPSWFLALAFSVGLLGFTVYPEILPESSNAVHWSLALTTSLLFFLSIVLHELGHAVVARAYGIPVRSITLFLLGGVAQITREVTRPVAELLIAAAGPAVSILLAGLFLAFMLVGGRHGPIGVMWTWLWLMNLSVGIFNLVPGFPMDGGRLLRASIWAVSGSYLWATRIAGWGGRLIAAALVVIGLASFARIAIPFASGPFSGLWLVFIGLYLDNAARQSLEMQRVLNYLRHYSAGDLVRRDVPTVDGATTVRDLLPRLLVSRDCEAMFVTESGVDGNDRVVGMVTRGQAITVPEQLRGRMTARALMLPAGQIEPASLHEDAASLLQRLESDGLAAVPVINARPPTFDAQTSGAEVVGLVGRIELLHLVERRGRR